AEPGHEHLLHTALAGQHLRRLRQRRPRAPHRRLRGQRRRGAGRAIGVEGVPLRGAAGGARSAPASDRALSATPRLADVVCFAAMEAPERSPWTLNLIRNLLHGDPGALSLFGANPFPTGPPHFVRAQLYRYAFAPSGSPDAAWWKRELLGPWLPPLAADDPR